jgi:hypothetical protein
MSEQTFNVGDRVRVNCGNPFTGTITEVIPGAVPLYRVAGDSTGKDGGGWSASWLEHASEIAHNGIGLDAPTKVAIDPAYIPIVRALFAASKYRGCGLNVLESNELDIAIEEIRKVYP